MFAEVIITGHSTDPVRLTRHNTEQFSEILHQPTAVARPVLRSGIAARTVHPSLRRRGILRLLAYQLLTTREAVPRLNSHDATKYCTKVLETLWNDELSIGRFEKAAEIVRKVADGNLHRDNIRTEPFTESLLNELNAK